MRPDQHHEMSSACFHCGATWQKTEQGEVMDHQTGCAEAAPLVSVGAYEVDPSVAPRLATLLQSDVRECAVIACNCPCDLGIFAPEGCICDHMQVTNSPELSNAWWRVARDLGFTAGGNRWAPV